MSDEELAELALRGELVEEARLQLDAELRSRGIKDLEPYRKLFEEERKRLVAHSERRFEKQKDAALFRFKIVAVMSFLFVLMEMWGWYHGHQKSAFVGFIATVTIVVLYWVYLKFRLMVTKKLLNPFLWEGQNQDRRAD